MDDGFVVILLSIAISLIMMCIGLVVGETVESKNSRKIELLIMSLGALFSPFIFIIFLLPEIVK